LRRRKALGSNAGTLTRPCLGWRALGLNAVIVPPKRLKDLFRDDVIPMARHPGGFRDARIGSSLARKGPPWRLAGQATFDRRLVDGRDESQRIAGRPRPSRLSPAGWSPRRRAAPWPNDPRLAQNGYGPRRRTKGPLKKGPIWLWGEGLAFEWLAAFGDASRFSMFGRLWGPGRSPPRAKA
jgi:hypothetical protein